MAEPAFIGRRTICSDPTLFRNIREWVAAMALKEGFTQQESLELTVAVNEACANIHRHAYSGRADGAIEFQVEVRKEMLHLRIRDFGRRFRPEACHRPDLQKPSEGGYGVFMIHELMDEVEYVRMAEGTELRMTKIRQGAPVDPKGRAHVGQA